MEHLSSDAIKGERVNECKDKRQESLYCASINLTSSFCATHFPILESHPESSLVLVLFSGNNCIFVFAAIGSL